MAQKQDFKCVLFASFAVSSPALADDWTITALATGIEVSY
jgi:hypothetical protein